MGVCISQWYVRESEIDSVGWDCKSSLVNGSRSEHENNDSVASGLSRFVCGKVLHGEIIHHPQVHKDAFVHYQV